MKVLFQIPKIGDLGLLYQYMEGLLLPAVLHEAECSTLPSSYDGRPTLEVALSPNLYELRFTESNPDVVVGVWPAVGHLFDAYPNAMKVYWVSHFHVQHMMGLVAQEIDDLRIHSLANFVPPLYQDFLSKSYSAAVFKRADVLLCSSRAVINSLWNYSPRNLSRTVYWPWVSRDLKTFTTPNIAKTYEFGPALEDRPQMVPFFEQDYVRARVAVHAKFVQRLQKGLQEEVEYRVVPQLFDMASLVETLAETTLHISVPIYDGFDVITAMALIHGVPSVVGPGSGMYDWVQASFGFPLDSSKHSGRLLQRLQRYCRYPGMRREFSRATRQMTQCLWPPVKDTARWLVNILREKHSWWIQRRPKKR